MNRLLTATAAAALVAFCGGANAGQIWTDGDGDGLPDGASFPATPSQNVTVGVWIDAQSFTWTNFLAYVEWSSDCISYVGAAYVISGGSNFPIDNFSHPRGIGFGGSGYTQGGVDLIGNVTLHVNTPVNCCVTPIIDVYNPYYVFSSLGNAPAGTYMLFTTNPGTCYGGEPPDCCGACCFPDGSCAIISASACSASGGVYQGNDTSCFTCPPPATEACCFPDCSCADMIPADCVNSGGNPQGPETSCTAVPCDCPPREACCFVDGSCVDAFVGECPPGSIPQGVGTTCAVVSCPPQTGACCIAPSMCIDGVTEADCGGAPWYPGLTCEALDCKINPTESKSWGRIKGLFR